MVILLKTKMYFYSSQIKQIIFISFLWIDKVMKTKKLREAEEAARRSKITKVLY